MEVKMAENKPEIVSGSEEDKLKKQLQDKKFLQLMTEVINILPHPPNAELIELEDPLPSPGGRTWDD